MSILDAHGWLYFAIPLSMAVIGYAAHAMALLACFRPLRFVGIRPIFGWQGLVPANAGLIAPRLFENIIDRVGTIRDVYQAMDPDRIADHLVLTVRPRMSEFIEDVILDADPQLWDELPDDVKSEVARRIEGALPEILPAITTDIDRKLEDLVDIDYIIKVRLVDDVRMLDKLFSGVGRRELAFVRNAGFPIGLIAGLVTLAVLTGWPAGIELPVVGALTFGLFDAAAVLAVFGIPTRRFGPRVRYGLLGADQERASRLGTRIITRDILTVRNLIDDVLASPNGPAARDLIRRHVSPTVHDALEFAKPSFRKSRTDDEIARLEDNLVDHAIDLALEPLADPTFNRERQVVLEDVFLNRMLDLSHDEFIGLIRPALYGTEWLLVVAGAAIGGVTGLVLDLLVS